MEAAYDFDLANQLGSVANLSTFGPTISQYAYPLYDRVGNRKALNKILASADPELTNYEYNDIYELTGVTGGQTHSFVYDNVGNRTAADGVSYVPNGLNQYTNVGSELFDYDDNGNLTSDGVRSLAYDEENQLTTADGSSYQYDALGRRVSKTVNGATTYYLNDGDDLIAEYDASSTLQAEYIEGPTIDDHLSMIRGGERFFYLQDGLGSVSEVLTDTGVVAEEYDYDVYGQSSVTTSSIRNPYRFTGRAFDEESGLYHYRARAYDPAIGRFSQKDPINIADDINLYRYARNNPGNFVDPSGRAVNLLAGAIGAAIGGVTGGVTAAINDQDVVVGIATGGLVGLTGGLTLGTSLLAEGIIGGSAAVAGNVVNQGITNYQDKRNVFDALNVRSLAVSAVTGSASGLAAGILAPSEGILLSSTSAGLTSGAFDIFFNVILRVQELFNGTCPIK